MAEERAISASKRLHFTADEVSTISDDPLTPEVDSCECHGHNSCGTQVLEIDGNGLRKDIHHGFEIESNYHENLGPRLFERHCTELENCTMKLLEIQNTDHEEERIELAIQFDGSNNASGSLHVQEHGDTEQLHANHQMCADDRSIVLQEGYHPAPVTGMVFESYGDAYNYYNSYAKGLGFAIRVKSSWTKRNSKEKHGAVLCCNCEGFKMAKESTSRRKETRTGCLAMIRLRLMESNTWRVDEVKHDHNHSFDPERALNSKSHKKLEVEAKKNSEPFLDVEVRTIKLYCTPASSLGRSTVMIDIQSKCLKLKEGDLQEIHDYFCQAQRENPNFMYLMDLNDEGQLRNVFWIDSRSRAAYSYFGDVVAIDTTYQSNKYDVPLVPFVGINQHLQPILLGCSLLVDQSVETYVWVLRAWLTCMLGRPPQTVITDQGKAIKIAIAEVLPRANHRLALPLVVQSIYQKLGPMKESQGFQVTFERTVYGCVRVEEFETSWGSMIERFGMEGVEWLQSVYEDRERWAPVYLKDSYLAGLFMSPGEPVTLFGGRVDEGSSVREFLNVCEALMQERYQTEENEEVMGVGVSHPYWLQLSKLYTQEVMCKFAIELEMMSSCVSIISEQRSGAVTTYMIKEEGDGESRSFEAMYDKTTSEVRCNYGCFYGYGYLCRHALCVLDSNGVEEIPLHYILPRWTRDCKRTYVLRPLPLPPRPLSDTHPMRCYHHLHKQAAQLVEQGMLSQDHYTVACQAFNDSLNKLRSPKPNINNPL